MPNYVIDPPAQPVVPVAGDDAGFFPVRRIFCVGRNYAEHAREMGHDPSREPPFFFTKPADALVISGADTPYPPATRDLHHEIELVVAIGREATGIDAGAALDHVWGYAAGIDLTRRDLQGEAKKLGRPWDMAKGFDASAPIGDLSPASRIGHPAAGRIELSVNGFSRQLGDISGMIWSVPDAIAYLSGFVTLMPGDLIFTGTPSGVAAVNRGDRLEGTIDGVASVGTTIA
ncbi:MAG: fumarylacetoacetate hydrolase family protein [Devosia sp.]|uniref:fumarylacetoacetate hydrolase family protein n=1 Tax=Devosia sp. TaxID=1871048 RepID=UPI001A630F71|nr:fumarylacetoacetate hydrolase family protein [Devosia sp.]MBL8598462.1 fumarylacetoacetate hydrolase family protein [Devosia sp.]